MFEYKIEGGYPVRGTIRASGNKNAALPCIAACLLTGEKVTLGNIPFIEDVQVMLDVLRELGADVNQKDKNTWEITAANLIRNDIPLEHSKKSGPQFFLQGHCLPGQERLSSRLREGMLSDGGDWTPTFLPLQNLGHG